MTRAKTSGSSTHSGRVSVLAVLGEGECFGEMSLLTGELTSAAVTARGEASVAAVPREELERLLEASPELSRAFTNLLAARLRAQNAWLEGELGRGILGQLSTSGHQKRYTLGLPSYYQ